ncbi:MAG: 3-deoxy-7-phosphoheptulonate synthase, partial [Oscillospiraceae bacterium]
MIVVLKKNPDEAQLNNLTSWIESMDIKIHRSEGVQSLILGLVGDTSAVDMDLIRSLDIVEDVKRIQEPYKNANRKFHPLDSVIDIGGVKIGGGHFQIMAGPCSIETEKQMCDVANSVKESGATILRGGAFKPRTSPYAFQGLRGDGIALLIKAKNEA